MLFVDPLQLKRLRDVPGGVQFTAFVDALVRAQGAELGIPQVDIKTNLRTNVRDGGVDTLVDQAADGDYFGLFGSKSVWQYKAEAYAPKYSQPAAVVKEVLEGQNREWIRDLVGQGYALRFCICDEVPVDTQVAWGKALNARAQAINSSAASCRVVSLALLAEWVNRFPALILQVLRSDVAFRILHLKAWGNSITGVTGVYVPVPAWADVSDRLAQHIDLSSSVADVVFPMTGEAGVGKTRMTYQTLLANPSVESLVLYTNDDEHAIDLARYLANDERVRAILVADECPITSRAELRTILRGAASRVRVITLDNSGEVLPGTAPLYRIDRMTQEDLLNVLASNYPGVPVDRRQTYAQLSGGFVRLAADMCTHDATLLTAGHLGPVLPGVREYLASRLSPEEREAIETLALLTRVGFRRGVDSELRALCDLVEKDTREVERLAHTLHDGPGFVGRGARYLYVTPEIVAVTAFENAWHRLTAGDPKTFLGHIPSEILIPFRDRVARSASPEVRQQVADFFFKTVKDFSPKDLADSERVATLVALVDTDPDTYVHVLAQAVDDAKTEQLLDVRGDSLATGKWGPRRNLIWLAERMARFPEHFEPAERILRKLALAENEPNIANNATAIWCQLFRIYLSGTSIPVPERLSKLKGYLLDQDPDISRLAVRALNIALDTSAFRVAGPSVIAGRLAPDEWRPESPAEAAACLGQIFALVREVADIEGLKPAAYDLAIENLHMLLTHGGLGTARYVIDRTATSHMLVARAIEQIEQFLEYTGSSNADEDRLQPQNRANLEDWVQSLRPPDLHGRLVTAISGSPWRRYHLEDDAWRQEVGELAAQLLSDPVAFVSELPWLHSPEAQSAGLLGQEIARQDVEGSLLQRLVGASVEHRSTALARGYIHGLTESDPAWNLRIEAMLARIEPQEPQVVYELSTAMQEAQFAFARALRLVNDGTLSAAYVAPYIFRPLGISGQDLHSVLKVLVQAVARGDTRAGEGALSALGMRLHDREDPAAREIVEDEVARDLVWELLEATSPRDTMAMYEWGQNLSALADSNPERAARLAARTVASDNLHLAEEAEKILIGMSSNHPGVVMEAVGRVMLDSDSGWRFYIGQRRELVGALPTDAVRAWVQENGLEAARRVARHLPRPELRDDQPTVPDLTAFVLSEFAEDDGVFEQFCAGMHSNQVYFGDVADQHEAEAEIARHFLRHPIKRIRDWARYEIESSKAMAEHTRQMMEEIGPE